MNGNEKTPRAIFLEALEIEDARKREDFLSCACEDNVSLRREVEALLQANASAGAFLPNRPGPSPVGDALLKTAESLDSDGPPGFPANEIPTERIGRYKILEQIGEGGWGVVYLAEQQEPVYRKVALKVTKLGMDTKAVVARFEAERQALALMDHPNIAKVLDAGATDTGRPYFVMELVRGIKITEYCDRKKLPIQERLELFIQVCQAVQHAHQKGIIHRDIKPSNILVTERDGQPIPKVIDFGIAKATGGLKLTDKTLFTAFELFIGTPDYMSPEQAAFGELDIDTRSDIYSLGVLLYELLTGKTPFDTKALLASGLDEVRRTIRDKEPMRPSTRLTGMARAELTDTATHRSVEVVRLIHGVRGDLDWIVIKCLEKERSRRYETSNSLAQDIERHMNSEPVIARPPSRLYEFRRAVRRHKVGFAAAAIVVTALILSVAILGYGLRKAGEEREAQRAVAYASDLNLCWQHWLWSGYADCRRLLANNIPKPGERDRRGFEWWYLYRLTKSDEAFSMGNIPGAIWGIALLPGDRIAAASSRERESRPGDASPEGGGLFVWDVKTRKLLAHPTVWGASDVSVSGDGKLIAVAEWRNKIQVLDANTYSKIRELTCTNEADRIQFSPRGQLLAIRESSAICLCDLSTNGSPQFISASDVYRDDKPAFSADGQLLAFVCPDGELGVWDVKKGALRKSLHNAGDVHLEGLLGLDPGATFLCSHAFSPDGRLLASGDAMGRVMVHDLEQGTLRLVWEHFDGRAIVGFSSDGRILASASLDGVIKLWDPISLKELTTCQGHDSTVYCLAFESKGVFLLSGGRGGQIRGWEVNSLPPPHDLFVESGIQFSPGMMATQGNIVNYSVKLGEGGSPNGRIVAYPGDPRPPTPSRKDTIIQYPVGVDRKLSRNGRFLADSNTNRIGRIRDLESGQEIAKYPIPAEEFIGAVSSDGKLMVSGSEDGRLFLHEVGHSDARQFPNGHAARVTAFAFSRRDDLIATGGRDGSVRVWDSQNLALIAEHRLPGETHFRGPQSIEFHPSGGLVACGEDSDMRLLLLPLKSSQPSRYLKMPFEGWDTRGIAFSPDGRWLAVTSASEQAAIYDWTSGKLVKQVGSGFQGYEHVTFTPDGHRLALLSSLRLSLWDMESGRQLFSMPNVNAIVDQLWFSENGERMVITVGDACKIYTAPRQKGM